MNSGKKLNRRIRIDERFDENEPMAAAMKRLLPPDSAMDPAARERLMGHLLSMQRSGSSRKGDRARPSPAIRRALVPALALLLAAAVLAAVLVPVFTGGSSKPEPVSSARARFLDLSGDVQVKTPGRAWAAAKAADRIAGGWIVRTGVDSTASVRFPDGSIARITDESQAEMSRIGAREVAIRHASGGTYHRVHKGTRYTVVNSGVTSSALGTAFNVENRVPGRLEILTVESAVEVAIGEHRPIKVSQGEVMTVTLSADKKADKQPVSRERLQDSRLVASVEQDARAGYSTGIYQNAGVPVVPSQESAQSAPAVVPSIQMNASLADLVVNLGWSVNVRGAYESLVLLRSEGEEPVYPDCEVARYADASISSATDNSVRRGHVYQYRIAAVPRESGEVLYSNTVVVEVPLPDRPPAPASVSLSVETVGGAVDLEWSVTGVERPGGFVLERVVEKAPPGSATPAGSASMRRFQSNDVFYSCVDDAVAPGHAYRYRVGLVVDGAVMVYSGWKTAALPSK